MADAFHYRVVSFITPYISMGRLYTKMAAVNWRHNCAMRTYDVIENALYAFMIFNCYVHCNNTDILYYTVSRGSRNGSHSYPAKVTFDLPAPPTLPFGLRPTRVQKCERTSIHPHYLDKTSTN